MGVFAGMEVRSQGGSLILISDQELEEVLQC